MAVSDQALKRYSDERDNGAHESRWVGGMALKCFIPYEQSQVKDFGPPHRLTSLTPIVEISRTSPVSRPRAQPMQLLVAPEVAHSGDCNQLTAEILIPAYRNTGRNLVPLTTTP